MYNSHIGDVYRRYPEVLWSGDKIKLNSMFSLSVATGVNAQLSNSVYIWVVLRNFETHYSVYTTTVNIYV